MKKFKLTSFDTPRAEAISDGVFAIVLTLLILEIKVPEIDWRTDAAQLRHKLFGLLPKFLSFFFSFANIYIFWVNHHLFFKYLKGINRDLLFLNGLFLLFLVMIPFPTAMIGEYYDNKTAIAFFGLVMFFASTAFTAMVHYAATRAHLFKDFLTPADIRQGLVKGYAGCLIQLTGIGITLIHPIAGLIYFAITPVAFIFAVKAEVNREQDQDSRFEIQDSGFRIGTLSA